MISNNVYYFNSGTSWVVPAGVTGIQVECYGSSYGASATTTDLTDNYSGGSYSKSNIINVTGGSTVYMNIGSLGGDTWFNTTNTAPTSSSSTSSACLAVGGNTNSASQVAANCGNIKYKGGNGLAVAGFYTTASGGQAGPNGNGADVTGPYTLTPYVGGASGWISYSGGGANGGSSGSLGVPPYGRSGTGTVGSGAYWNGTTFIYTSGIPYIGFIDPVGQYSYINNRLVSTLVDYGPYGGSVVTISPGCGCSSYNLADQKGFIVITLLYGRKFIVVNTTGNNSFTAPSDFNSLVSTEAVGAGGAGNAVTSGTTRYGGGGGGGYSKSTSVTASIVAGSTIIYTNVAAGGGGTAASSWLNIGTNSAPTSNTTGVLAYSGGNAVTNTGGAGATTTGAIGTGSIFGGGAGGAGSTSTRLNAGGGGGAGGPLGAGGAGGAADNTTANKGSGGGGGANLGATGVAGTSTTSGAGGTGSNGAGAGGTGNTAASPSSATQGASGPSGGGGGGGSGFSYPNAVNGGAVNNSVYQIGGGTGGKGIPTIDSANISIFAGAGGCGNNTSAYAIGGTGLVVFAYVPNAAPVVTNTSNFLAFF